MTIQYEVEPSKVLIWSKGWKICQIYGDTEGNQIKSKETQIHPKYAASDVQIRSPKSHKTIGCSHQIHS